MIKISSRFTFLAKYLNPACVSIVYWILTKGLIHKVQMGQLKSYLYLSIAMAAIIIIVLILNRFITLLDEVEEDEDYLYLRRGSKKVKIHFSDILKFTLSRSNPPIIFIYLKKPCSFGMKVSFVPHMSIFSFQKVQAFEDLQTKLATIKH